MGKKKVGEVVVVGKEKVVVLGHQCWEEAMWKKKMGEEVVVGC